MKNTYKKILWFVPLTLLLTACPLPDVSEYSEVTLEMAEAVKGCADKTIQFLEESYEVQPAQDEVDPLLLADFAELLGEEQVPKVKDYPKELRKNWEMISQTLDALVAYSDALASITQAGEEGKESFNNLSNSLNSLLSVAGISPMTKAATTVGKYLYGAVADIRANNKLEEVITNADTVVQYIALQLDTALYNMEIINDVAQSENLLAFVDSEETQQHKKYFESLVKKETKNIKKITLINDYENGDYESLLFFVFEDPLSLDRLKISKLTKEIAEINKTPRLSPQEKLDRIRILAEQRYRSLIEQSLNNHLILTRLDLDKRREAIQEELGFLRAEIRLQRPVYDEIITREKNIKKAAQINEELIRSSRKLVASWSHFHSQMKNFFKEKQKFSFNEVKLYINEIKALKEELNQISK